MVILLILAAISIIFACVESYRAWGVPASVGIGVGFSGVIFIMPFGTIITIIACVSIFGAARMAKLRNLAKE